MTPPDLSRLVTAVFVRHLAAEHNASPHTTKSYRDALKLLLRFAADACHRQAAGLQIDDLTPDLILRFLTDLETTRRNSVRTRNARLAAAAAPEHWCDRGGRQAPAGLFDDGRSDESEARRPSRFTRFQVSADRYK